MQLIEITTIPFRYELQIENASFKRVETPDKDLDISNQIDHATSSDSPQPRYDIVDFSNTSSGESNLNNKSSQNGSMSGVYTKNDVQSTAIKKGNTNTSNITTTSTDTINTTNSVNSDYKIKVVDNESPPVDIMDKPEYEFSPPSVTMRVINMASVEIKYLAGPTYVPPSSDPDYKDKE